MSIATPGWPYTSVSSTKLLCAHAGIFQVLSTCKHGYHKCAFFKIRFKKVVKTPRYAHQIPNWASRPAAFSFLHSDCSLHLLLGRWAIASKCCGLGCGMVNCPLLPPPLPSSSSSSKYMSQTRNVWCCHVCLQQCQHMPFSFHSAPTGQLSKGYVMAVKAIWLRCVITVLDAANVCNPE